LSTKIIFKGRSLKFIIILFLFSSASLYASNSLIGSIAKIPYYSDTEHSPYRKLFKKFLMPLDGEKILVEYYPYKRSLNMLTHGESDFHYPVARSHNELPEGLKYSGFYTHYGDFGLFYRDDISFEITNDLLLNKDSKLKIEAIKPHKNMYFKDYENIKIAPCAKCGLKKIVGGRIDGFLFEKYAGLKALHEAGIKSVKYKSLKSFPIHFLLRDDDDYSLNNEILRKKFLEATRDGSQHHMFMGNIELILGSL
jgi:hypothetical protein